MAAIVVPSSHLWAFRTDLYTDSASLLHSIFITRRRSFSIEPFQQSTVMLSGEDAGWIRRFRLHAPVADVQ